MSNPLYEAMEASREGKDVQGNALVPVDRSDSKREGSNRVLDEKILVNTAEVDSVGGAKPEPEERPLLDAMKLEPNKVALSTGKLVDSVNNMTAIQETTVFDALQAFGKHCGYCKHFNLRKGQEEILRMRTMGSPEERKMLQELRAQLLESGAVESLNDFASLDEVFHDETKEFIGQMGACEAASSVALEVQLMHPSQNGCPTRFANGNPFPWLYEPKDSSVAQRDKENQDLLMGKASGKIL